LFWNYKSVEQESFLGVDNYYIDGWEKRGDVVDFFSHAKGLRQKAFYLKGMPYASEQPTNLLLHSRELDDLYWTQQDDPILTQNEEGFDGQANMAWTMQDDSVSLNRHILRIFNIGKDDLDYYCGSTYVKKDSDETRFPSIQILLSIGATTYVGQCQINTQTGEVKEAYGDSFAFGSVDSGKWWKVWVTMKSPGNVGGGDNVLVSIYLTPSHASTLGHKGEGTTAVGTTIFDFPFLEKGETSPTLRNLDNLVGQELSSDVIHLFYVSVPERADATSDLVELQDNFVKYLEYKVASRLLKSDTEIRDEIKAKHYEIRYSIGIKLVKKVIGNLMRGKVHQLGREGFGIGRKPPYPRLPDHYPKLGVR